MEGVDGANPLKPDGIGTLQEYKGGRIPSYRDCGRDQERLAEVNCTSSRVYLLSFGRS